VPGVPTHDPLIAFGTRLRELRTRKNLSQEKLAELADLHRNYVGLLERGQSNVSLVTLVALARALSVRPFKLIERIR
jgi:transcriptional regulator with XRE-family HTH domain